MCVEREGESSPANYSLSSHSEVLSLQPGTSLESPRRSKFLLLIRGMSRTLGGESKEGRRALRPEVKGWGGVTWEA